MAPFFTRSAPINCATVLPRISQDEWRRPSLDRHEGVDVCRQQVHLVTGYFHLKPDSLQSIKANPNRIEVSYSDSLLAMTEHFNEVTIVTDPTTWRDELSDLHLRRNIELSLAQPVQEDPRFLLLQHELLRGATSIYTSRESDVTSVASYLATIQRKLECLNTVQQQKGCSGCSLIWLDAGVFQRRLERVGARNSTRSPMKLHEEKLFSFGATANFRSWMKSWCGTLQGEGNEVTGAAFAIRSDIIPYFLQLNESVIRQSIRSLSVVPTEQASIYVVLGLLPRDLRTQGEILTISGYSGAVNRIINGTSHPAKQLNAARIMHRFPRYSLDHVFRD